MEMIRCPRCAREIPDFSHFCRRCGCAIVWRGQFSGAAAGVPPVVEQPYRPTTLGSGRQVKAVKASPPARVKPSVRSSGSGGAGIFAILAAAGLVCFVNYHAVMRPVSTPARVRYQQIPAMPEMPAEREDITAAPYVVPQPPPSYPPPPQHNASSSWSRRYVTQPPPTVPMPRTPGAQRTPDGIIVMPPVSPWEADHRYGSSPRDERDRDR
jgi:hypothetical protein